MKLAYIAGPYRGPTREAVALNIEVARKVGLLAAQKGWAPLIPQANTAGFEHLDPRLHDEFWLGATMEMMRRCDAVVLCPGWQNSSGTLAEIAEAERLGLPIFYTVEALPDPHEVESRAPHADGVGK